MAFASFGIEPPGLLVGQRGGLLDLDDGIHEGRQRSEPGNGVVFDGTEGLDAVEGIGGDGLFAEGIFFDAGLHEIVRLIGEQFTMQPEEAR